MVLKIYNRNVCHRFKKLTVTGNRLHNVEQTSLTQCYKQRKSKSDSKSTLEPYTFFIITCYTEWVLLFLSKSEKKRDKVISPFPNNIHMYINMNNHSLRNIEELFVFMFLWEQFMFCIVSALILLMLKVEYILLFVRSISLLNSVGVILHWLCLWRVWESNINVYQLAAVFFIFWIQSCC